MTPVVDAGSNDKVARNVINMVISLVAMRDIMAESFAIRQSKTAMIFMESGVGAASAEVSVLLWEWR